MYKKIIFGFIVTIFFALGSASAQTLSPPRCYFQIKVYHYKTKDQEDKLNQYFKNAYKPALKRAAISLIGFFNTTEQDTDKRFYVLLTFYSKGRMDGLEQRLAKDTKYQADAKDYLDANFDSAPYTRIETIVLYAFRTWKLPHVPKLTANKPDRIYELRSYESPTEKYHVNKVKMFNDGDETGLFARLGFNAVFYGDVLIGSHMPNLMYMTAFENKADRDKHWETFSNDPQWKTLVAKPEYAHNVSKADIIFLHPTEYSDF